jgi:hypothetical protein
LIHIYRFLDYLAEELDIGPIESWYNVKPKEVRYWGGSAMLEIYGDSFRNALRAGYPETQWEEAKPIMPPGFWSDSQNRFQFMEWIRDKFDIRSMEDWYRVRPMEILELGGAPLLRASGGLGKALELTYPQVKWQIWRFESPGEAYWKGDVIRAREFLDWIAEDLGIHLVEDWYKIGRRDLDQRGGQNLVGELNKLLKEHYPFTQWQSWRFQGIPNGYWEDPQQKREFLLWIADQLCLDNPQDWENVRSYQISQMGGRSSSKI